MKQRIFLVAFLFSITTPLVAQDTDPAARWESTIQKFEAADQQEMPAAGGVLFVGSSSIRMWDTDKWFPDDAVINRGFGGSQISDVLAFADRIVLKYKPRVIVFYAGDNDIAAGKSPERVAADFRHFAELVEGQLPGAHILYLPIKPSLARWKLWPTMAEANGLIRRFLETRCHWQYLDTDTVLLNQQGQPRDDVFAGDGLHLNNVGYELWSKIVKPHIDRARQTPEQIASGVVYQDANGNGRLDRG